MSKPIIEIQGLSKRYKIGYVRHTLLRDRLGALFRNIGRGREEDQGTFWALRDIAFEVAKGEVIGIIGHNGAGKSTLLKILSRITEATTGRITLRGRIASLLEVGTGFHGELSGRENIYLNGAILGMSRAEIRRKFDAIVAFAEIERFLDTAVKHYSSGMYVRLAFAVAAHLEPEILIVDEVLAVGDVAFQKKCLGKMQSIAQDEGRTVLFVGHNMGAVSQLTQRCVVLKAGRVEFIGKTPAAVELYLGGKTEEAATAFDVSQAPRLFPGNGAARILELRYERRTPQFAADEPFACVIRIEARAELERLRASLTIFSNDGTPVGTASSGERSTMRAGQTGEFRLALGEHRLAPGRYYCNLGISRGAPFTAQVIDYDVVTQVLPFEVLPPGGEDGTLSSWTPGCGRIVYPELHFESAGR
ncbi:MAG TPA: ABC transporter ATP-binding protein [Opitutaceae bacterium]|nr:ABC transporter ATP-binding protein [Opitutaceae bacterium]